METVKPYLNQINPTQDTMKQSILTSICAACFCMLALTSCYQYNVTVGQGAKGGQVVTKWNHYVLFGLAPVGVSDAKALAGGASDYTVNIKHSFVNGLVTGLTFGIYTPTTTTVTK
jgi:hypothetical protein